jgi:hypothetical protein
MMGTPAVVAWLQCVMMRLRNTSSSIDLSLSVKGPVLVTVCSPLGACRHVVT